MEMICCFFKGQVLTQCIKRIMRISRELSRKEGLTSKKALLHIEKYRDKMVFSRAE